MLSDNDDDDNDDDTVVTAALSLARFASTRGREIRF